MSAENRSLSRTLKTAAFAGLVNLLTLSTPTSADTLPQRPTSTNPTTPNTRIGSEEKPISREAQNSRPGQLLIKRSDLQRVAVSADTTLPTHSKRLSPGSSYDILDEPNIQEAMNKYNALGVKTEINQEVRATGIDTNRWKAEMPALLFNTSIRTSFANLGWHITRTRVQDAWEITRGSGIKIAILDTGVDFSHPALYDKQLTAANFSNSPFGSQDFNGHGTSVAGTAVSRIDTFSGLTGIAPEAVYLNGKILNDEGIGSAATVIQGIDWAINNRAQVINLSVGADGPCPEALQEMINRATENNIIIVAAAGNYNKDHLFLPSNCNNVLAVGSTNFEDKKSGYSNYTNTDRMVFAPGGGEQPGNSANNYIVTTGRSPSRVIWMYGTSLSSPQVAGEAALILAANKHNQREEVIKKIITTGRPVPEMINRRVDIGAALDPCLDPIKITTRREGQNIRVIAEARKGVFSLPTVPPTRNGNSTLTTLSRAGESTIQFSVIRSAAGPIHQPVVLTDGCGPWQTFFGIGS